MCFLELVLFLYRNKSRALLSEFTEPDVVTCWSWFCVSSRTCDWTLHRDVNDRTVTSLSSESSEHVLMVSFVVRCFRNASSLRTNDIITFEKNPLNVWERICALLERDSFQCARSGVYIRVHSTHNDRLNFNYKRNHIMINHLFIFFKILIHNIKYSSWLCYDILMTYLYATLFT